MALCSGPTILIEAIRRYRAKEEEDVKRMLGMWVSELEPALAYGPTHVEIGGIRMSNMFPQLIGLTVAGRPVGSEQLIVIRR